MNTRPPPPAAAAASPPARAAQTRTHAQTRAWAWQLASYALRVLLIGSAIAVIITVLFRQSFWPTYVYTLCITACCWSLTQGGLKLSVRWVGEGRPGWPPLRWVVPIVLVATVVGYALGNELGNLLTGYREPGLLSARPRQALTMLLVSLLPAIAFTYFFYVRERVAHAEAQAQAAQRAAAENQLRLLESQLEPHMLFNTLANLRVLITLDPPRAQAMLDRLIAFLRATLAASRQGEHTLATEFQRLEDYLALMAVRMGPRLVVHLDLPTELRHLPMPALLLQPLVENAIQHGLEPKVEGGRVSVTARREGPQLRLTVRDTGVGLRPGAATGRADTAPSVAADAGTGSGMGFGTTGVRERLAVLHGTQAHLDLRPADDAEGGTVATVTLPLPLPLPQ